MSMIRVENLTFAYPGSYDHVFENVSFQFDTAWKLGFLGRNGRGKTTFLRLLRGESITGNGISSTCATTSPLESEPKSCPTIGLRTWAPT